MQEDRASTVALLTGSSVGRFDWDSTADVNAWSGSVFNYMPGAAGAPPASDSSVHALNRQFYRLDRLKRHVGSRCSPQVAATTAAPACNSAFKQRT